MTRCPCTYLERTTDKQHIQIDSFGDKPQPLEWYIVNQESSIAGSPFRPRNGCPAWHFGGLYV
jgi:hypothetical protein